MGIPWRLPKIQLALLLFLVYLSSLVTTPLLQLIFHLGLVLGSVFIFDYLFLKVRNIQPFLLSAALVSGLIIALLADPALPFYKIILICALAMFSKNFIRVGNSHIFNPAGFGLFLGGIIFTFTVSWWGVSYQRLFPFSITSIILFLILITPGWISAVRMKRYRIIIPFLLFYSFFLLLITGRFDFELLSNTLIDPTALFFAIVMLPEPMTTPNKPFRQLIFGTFVAILAVIVSMPIFSDQSLGFNLVSDPLILALLLGNLVFFKFK
ncbi:MAG: hypothetical protein ACD_30C00002G0035 [uncultured bacterium]|uniref:Uncharacterized protein n=4 Tax=Candidatus Daviesiibacteriota TaxID=1752718 RepID=A0A0G0HE88_9BACT|nr:MAG: hypothetical protein ACD_30C00002G0035 [uncultured bacterium]KKQ10429.1 MAG: hypothetical protein US19_C0005G0041 [Candidatus Daviesbacteria bacterium GW2011_GWB1_36_5]KKQ13615.1 MAG: hypothetical protein US28_C0047G0001 [Candidatus Daviesbacteria bacterium GW2011_GWA1_36_8]OGE16588.1 MAG: hypothetical protein A2858_01950 [Candidatus Daviesbacteria bacterium RIFCSPHIGHO2_01_FULL_36_37]OGE31731.1 MAG: hypothetical protein A3C99_02855 [Candidatus Daviesbacteria bacterium RIFCSPHIGHO2_02_F